MENIILGAFIALFAAAAGFGLGAGNYKGVLGAIIPGAVAGLLAAIPVLREQEYLLSAVMVLAGIAGSVACSFVSDTNRLKVFLRTQSNLRISCGSYKLGEKPKWEGGSQDGL